LKRGLTLDPHARHKGVATVISTLYTYIKQVPGTV
jgi:hypothetical protein